MCWSHYTTPPQVFRASLTRGKSSCIWYGVMRPHARPLNIIILLWSGGILVMGGFINLKEKCLIFGEKIPVFIILVVKKKINRPLFSYGSKYRWRYLLITMYSPKYSDVCFCVFLSSVRWGGLGANFDSERMSPTSRPSLSFW